MPYWHVNRVKSKKIVDFETIFETKLEPILNNPIS